MLLLATKIAAAPTRTDYHLTYPIDNATGTIYKPSEIPLAVVKPKAVSSQHPIRASHTISEDSLRRFLELHKSPLSGYSDLIAASPYASTIVGISAIEQRYCLLRPQSSPFNCWGMGGSRLKRYSGFPEAIQDIDGWLARHEAKYPTIESLNCYYVQPCSPNWLNTVLKVKAEVENL